MSEDAGIVSEYLEKVASGGEVLTPKDKAHSLQRSCSVAADNNTLIEVCGHMITISSISNPDRSMTAVFWGDQAAKIAAVLCPPEKAEPPNEKVSDGH